MVPRPARAFFASLSALGFAVCLAVGLASTACSSISVVRVQSDNVYVGPNLRPIAVVQAQATTAYLLFLPLPGGVDLDRVVNRMLIVAAKTLGADKVANLQVDITPDGGVWTLRKILGWRSAQASGIAVVVDDPVDGGADQGPEPRPATPPATPPAGASASTAYPGKTPSGSR
jgi:hypothetical protein